MRILSLVALLLLTSCNNGFLAPHDVSGTWAVPSEIPGSSFTFTLGQAGNRVVGSGIYTIEAGPGGTLTVSGWYDRPALRLRFDQSSGGRIDFVGQVVADEIRGTEQGTFGTFAVVFVRR